MYIANDTQYIVGHRRSSFLMNAHCVLAFECHSTCSNVCNSHRMITAVASNQKMGITHSMQTTEQFRTNISTTTIIMIILQSQDGLTDINNNAYSIRSDSMKNLNNLNVNYKIALYLAM